MEYPAPRSLDAHTVRDRHLCHEIGQSLQQDGCEAVFIVIGERRNDTNVHKAPERLEGKRLFQRASNTDVQAAFLNCPSSRDWLLLTIVTPTPTEKALCLPHTLTKVGVSKIPHPLPSPATSARGTGPSRLVVSTSSASARGRCDSAGRSCRQWFRCARHR